MAAAAAVAARVACIVLPTSPVQLVAAAAAAALRRWLASRLHIVATHVELYPLVHLPGPATRHAVLPTPAPQLRCRCRHATTQGAACTTAAAAGGAGGVAAATAPSNMCALQTSQHLALQLPPALSVRRAAAQAHRQQQHWQLLRGMAALRLATLAAIAWWSDCAA